MSADEADVSSVRISLQLIITAFDLMHVVCVYPRCLHTSSRVLASQRVSRRHVVTDTSHIALTHLSHTAHTHFRCLCIS